MTDDYVKLVSDRYIELYENITGEKFIKSDTSSIVNRIQTNVDNFLNSYE
jgi:phosphoribosylaminoimidazole-succinocarboxamide synthase